MRERENKLSLQKFERVPHQTEMLHTSSRPNGQVLISCGKSVWMGVCYEASYICNNWDCSHVSCSILLALHSWSYWGNQEAHLIWWAEVDGRSENIIHARKLQKDMLIGVSNSPCFTAWESINSFSLLHRYCTMLFTWLDIKTMELFLARVSTLAVKSNWLLLPNIPSSRLHCFHDCYSPSIQFFKKFWELALMPL